MKLENEVVQLEVEVAMLLLSWAPECLGLMLRSRSESVRLQRGLFELLVQVSVVLEQV